MISQAPSTPWLHDAASLDHPEARCAFALAQTAKPLKFQLDGNRKTVRIMGPENSYRSIRVVMHSGLDSSVVAANYPADRLLRFSRLAQEQLVDPNINTLIVPTCWELAPRVDGLQIALAWLMQFPSNGFASNYHGHPQLGPEEALRLNRNKQLSLELVIRIHEALYRLKLIRPQLFPQYILRDKVALPWITQRGITHSELQTIWFVTRHWEEKFVGRVLNRCIDMFYQNGCFTGEAGNLWVFICSHEELWEKVDELFERRRRYLQRQARDAAYCHQKPVYDESTLNNEVEKPLVSTTEELIREKDPRLAFPLFEMNDQGILVESKHSTVFWSK